MNWAIDIDGPAEYTYLKAIAFRLLFWDTLKERDALGQFSQDYRQVLELVMDYLALPKNRIYEIKGFYKGLFNL